MSASEKESMQRIDEAEFEYYSRRPQRLPREQLHCFYKGFEIIPIRIDKDEEDARRLLPDPSRTPPPRTESETQAAERRRVQGMNREELQAFLASRLSGV